MTDAHRVFTTSNVRRAARLWAFGALLAAPLFLILGVAFVAGVFPSGGEDRPLELQATAAPGQLLDSVGGPRGMAVWGQPADVELAEIRCTWSSGRQEGDLPVEPDTARQTGTDRDGLGTLVLLTTTEDAFAAPDATCEGGGLTLIASAAAGPTSSGNRAFGWLLIAGAPVLLGAGLLARRSTNRASFVSPRVGC